ncbi:Di-N-acetylchitobiase-like protein [Dinothrombium tinctorium]|uniref:Di-N-acetylchitobiase n=1 Tax=Dinothrombium tinctorium TaxID=1965070 RepID=A0A443QWA1_9ACAR|nr:Di-N-acetylchitobiase-like protein [Dinothrombium tinctorium]
MLITVLPFTVFTFVLPVNRSVWQKFNWNKLTTIALAGFVDRELICHAHRKGVRVVFIANYPSDKLLNESYRTNWIKEKLVFARENKFDGINFDFEDPIPRASAKVKALTELVAETRKVFHTHLPGSQVTFDVPWSPINELGNGVDGRNYDFIGLANNCDFLFVMAYDIQSQMLYANGNDDECYARANSGLFDVAGGLMAYMRLGINTSKLVLGQPWYGYDYECITYGDFYQCKIKRVSFRGANCSDAAGKQLPYSTIQEIIKKGGAFYYDEHSRTPYVLYKDKQNRTHQIWYDDKESLFNKYAYAAAFSLRGVGVWTINYVNYSQPQQIKDMWSVLPNYRRNVTLP